MTANRNLKRRIRTRAARTGESYAAARHQLLGAPAPVAAPALAPVSRSLTVAVAQVPLRPDPGDVAQIEASGAAVRALMRQAAARGAGLVLFPEGALTSPAKQVMSSTGPDDIGPADWGRADWAALGRELEQVMNLAGELGIWVVAGGIDRPGGAGRPVNCVFVVSDQGRRAGRYDERMLSRTKGLFMYSPGTRPLVFTAGGLRFGCALGMETHYAELFAAYEELGVDAVLFATHGSPENPGVFAVEAAGHAAANSFWVGYAGPAQDGHPPAGLLTPEGDWAARCTTHGPELAVADVVTDPASPARAWRRLARAAIGSRPGTGRPGRR
jgi:predicted amidohydrolase